MTVKLTVTRVAVALVAILGILAIDANASEWDNGYNSAVAECNILLTERDDDFNQLTRDANARIDEANELLLESYEDGFGVGSATMYNDIKSLFEKMCSRDIVMEVAGGVLICVPNAKEM